MTNRFRLDRLIPHFNDMAIIHVYSDECHLKYIPHFTDKPMSFKEILEKAHYDLQNRCPCFIIVETPMSGTIYQIGNYTDKYVYVHGETKGYA